MFWSIVDDWYGTRAGWATGQRRCLLHLDKVGIVGIKLGISIICNVTDIQSRSNPSSMLVFANVNRLKSYIKSCSAARFVTFVGLSWASSCSFQPFPTRTGRPNLLLDCHRLVASLPPFPHLPYPHSPPRSASTKCSVAPPSRLYSFAVLSSALRHPDVSAYSFYSPSSVNPAHKSTRPPPSLLSPLKLIPSCNLKDR